jgi:Cd2+/Zn2+-exporting ATPase
MPRTNPKAAVGEDTMPESVRCAEVMEAFLHSNSGIRGVSLHFQDGEYRLRYDPGQISLVRVKQLSRQLGIDLDRRYERCTLRSRGMSCGDCTAHVTKSLGGTPAVVRVDVNPAAQIISVEYDPREADLPTFERRLRKAGYRAEPLPGTRAAYQASERRDRALRRRMGTLTVLCLAALVTGWVLQSATAAPQAVVLAVFAAAYLAGGFYSSAQVVRELRSGTITVDFLMITAALGAAAIGQWREGAILLFLFSLSNTLEQYVLGRTRRAIESLMDLTPEAAVVRRNGREERLPVEDLRLGDLVVVRPGERIAADGTVRAGPTSVD